jgi:hypothetical protein
VKNLLSQLKKQSVLVQFLAIGWLVLIILLPFHAFISTWGGTTIGPLNLWKAWKEILLSLLVFAVIIQSFVDKDMFRYFWKSWITRLIVIFGLLHLLIAIIIGNQSSPLAFGLAINLRIVSMFLVGGVVFYYIRPDKKELIRLLLIPAGLVILLGLLQMFILPYNLLSHFGYKEGVTIAPFNTIDQQIDQLRIMSTLRGPNPLGAYLILPGVLLLGLIISVAERFKIESSKKSFKLAIGLSALLAGLLIVLYGSHSRSAWLGFVVSAGVYLIVKLSTKWRLVLVSIGLLGVVIGSFGLYQLRDTSFVQNVILHDNPEVGPEQTSNSDHN